MCRKLICLAFFALVVMAAPVEADTLSGLADVTVVDGAIVSLRDEGTEYVVADGDLILGTTTRWYVDAGVETLWAEGDPAPAATVPGASDPKDGDVGSKADNFLFTLEGSTNISSIDGIDFQETIFPSLTDTFFLFERGGNDVGTWQAILADGSLGAEVAFEAANVYTNTGVNVNGQDAYGVVFKTDVPVQGVRITAAGHDTLSISTPASEVDENGRLIVPKTSVAPIIDGELDGVWHNVGETRCLITDMINTSSATPENWYDLFGTFKAMYDANNFYIFVEVQDSVLDYEFSTWNGDGVEIYFDGDNSKGSSYDGVNDNQIRITVDDVEMADIDSSLSVEGAAFKVLLTDLGYNIEASFPLEMLQIYPSEDPDNIIGFEVQINDNDSAGGRETLGRWHSDDNDSWQNPSLFGEAQLVSRTVGDMLDVARVVFDPNIDGVMEADWEALPEITGNKYVLTESDLSKQIDFTDARFSFRTGWDDENIYFFVSVLDDMYYDLTTNHTSDGIELFFDADNSKTFETYDQVDDVQLRINHGDTTPADIDISGGSRAPANVTKDNINFVVVDTAVGYDMEIAIPLADLALPAETGHVFGFDLFLNDADEDTRDNIRNYWSGINDNWQWANLFGEAVLMGGEEAAGPVAWWKLDDNADDNSGNGHNGTVEGAPTWISPGWDGTGSCMQFGGDSDRITVESFDVAGTGITLAAWINVIAFQDDARMVSKSQGSGTAEHYWAMILSGSGEDNLEFRLKTDTGSTTRRTAPEGSDVLTNEWTHVAVTWDAGDPFMRLYKNGIEIDSVSKDGGAVATGADVKIGIGNQSATVPGDGGIRPFGGLIDEVQVYDRGLSPAEILELSGQ